MPTKLNDLILSNFPVALHLTEVIFYYLKTTNGGKITPPVQPVQPVGPAQPAQPTAPSQSTPVVSGQGTPTAGQELPQTGN